MIKIAFFGTHSTGKTMRAKIMSKSDNLLLVSGVARSCPLPINLKTSRLSQLYIFVSQIQWEIEQMALAPKKLADGIVCDRCVLDALVYSTNRGFVDLVDLLLPLTKKWLRTYSKLFWCRPAPNLLPEKDGVRCADWMWQKEIDRGFERFVCDVLCLDVEVIQNTEFKCPSLPVLTQGIASKKPE